MAARILPPKPRTRGDPRLPRWMGAAGRPATIVTLPRIPRRFSAPSSTPSAAWPHGVPRLTR